MDTKLLDLKDKLQVERQQLAEKLSEINNKLASIDTVLDLLKEQDVQTDESQLPLINIEQVSDRFSGLGFKKAVNILFKDYPEKWWAPKDIILGMLKEGFESDSKKFENTARTMLGHMRKKGEVDAIKRERGQGYLYKYKEKDSGPHMAEPESMY